MLRSRHVRNSLLQVNATPLLLGEHYVRPDRLLSIAICTTLLVRRYGKPVVRSHFGSQTILVIRSITIENGFVYWNLGLCM